MKTTCIYIISLWLLVHSAALKAQCNFEFNQTIVSQSTAEFDIYISGLVNDQLGINQSVCAVNLDFEHSSLTNFRIKLISPDGDEVYLIGPATTAISNTQFIEWMPMLVPCGSSVSPDSGIPDVWNNGANWVAPLTYTGTYYPSAGCLQDFDSGSANGTWRVIIEDLGMGTTGSFNGVELVFCDTEGITCESCDLNISNRFVDDISAYYCEGSYHEYCFDNLFLSSDISSPIQSLVLVDNTGAIYQFRECVEIHDLSDGTYQIYGLVSQSPLGIDILNLTDLNTLIQADTTCIALSSEYFSIIIGSPINSETISQELCSDEAFSYNGVRYTAPLDTTFATYSDQGCDSVLTVVLTEYSLICGIDPVLDSLGCNEQLVLSATNETVSQSGGISYNWSTSNGTIVSGESTPFAIVNQAGEYTLTVSDGVCSSSSDIMIVAAHSATTASIGIVENSCADGQLQLEIISEIGVVSVEWQGGAISGSTDFMPVVNSSGTYTAMVEFDTPNCSQLVLSLDVLIPLSSGYSVVKSNDIDCQNAIVTLELIGDLTDTLSVIWTDTMDMIVGQGNEITVSEPGTYYCSLSQGNGCSYLREIIVNKDESLPAVNLMASEINCEVESSQITTTNIDGSTHTYEWSGPDQYSSITANNIVTQSGWYYVKITNEFGCSSMDSVLVPIDTVAPTILNENFDYTLPCSGEGVRLEILTDVTNPRYFWHFVDSDSSVVQLDNTGQYYFTVIDDNGCSATNFFTVSESNDTLIPKFDIDVDFCQGKATLSNWQIYDASNNLVPIESIKVDNQLVNQSELSLASGDHMLTFTVADGCSADTMLTVPLGNDLTISTDDNYCISEQSVVVEPIVNYNGDLGEVTYDWSNNGSSSATAEYSLSDIGQQSLTVTDTDGCSAVAVFAIDDCTMDERDDFIFIPNIFSPNAQVPNNQFVIMVGSDIEVFEINIYDRWGNLVFYTNDYKQPWLGVWEGKSLEQGVYVCNVIYKKNGVEANKVSDITLIK